MQHDVTRIVFSLPVALALFTNTQCVLAQSSQSSAVLLQDLNRVQSANYRPIEVGEVLAAPSAVFFAATTEVDTIGRTRDLWLTTGSTTKRILGPRDESVAPTNLTVHATTLLFTGTTAELGSELWAADASSGVATPLADIAAGPSASRPSGFASAFGRVFVLAQTNTACELWSTDGQKSKTQRVASLAGCERASDELQLAGSALYFAVTRNAATELWRSDGSTSGTRLVHTLPIQDAAPRDFVTSASRLYFRTRSTSIPATTALWTSDGTAQGTVLLTDGVTTAPVDFAGKLYFGRTSPATGAELATTDGTPAGTKTIELLPGTLGSDPAELQVVGSKLYFGAWSPMQGREAWVSDGTRAGTRSLGDLVPGLAGLDPAGFTAFGARVAFRSDRAARDGDLWLSDGSAQGSINLTRGQPRVVSTRFATLPGLAFFAGRQPFSSTIDLYFTPPLPGVTRKVAASSKPSTPHSDGAHPKHLQDLGDRVIFQAFDGKQTRLGETRGDAPSTRFLAIADPLPADPRFRTFGCLGPLYFFSGVSIQASLHVSDGTTQGTKILRDPRTQSEWLAPWSFVRDRGRLLFHAVAPSGPGVFESDGTDAGTQNVQLVGANSRVSELQSFGDAVYFVEDTLLHRIDASGSTLVAQCPHRIAPAQRCLRFGRELAFATSDANGSALCFFDGRRLRSIALRGSADVHEFLRAGEKIFFRQGSALWVSDGTASGTRALAAKLEVNGLLAVGSRAFFAGRTQASGSEAWVSDGTSLGTRQVLDLEAGPASSDPKMILSLGSRALFATHQGTLWLTDGSAQGTQMLRAKSGRALVSRAARDATTRTQIAALHRGRLLLSARASALGEEIWTLFPGASVQERGRASSAPSTRNPRLSSDAPRIGQSWQIEGHGFQAAKPVVLFVGATARTLAIGAAELYVDLATLHPLAVVMPTRPDWRLPTPLPPDRALIGLSASLQCLQASDATLGFDLSNALEITIGS